MNYPHTDRDRPSHMDPTDGELYPEERELLDWLSQSEYKFADREAAAHFDWNMWSQWVVPVRYMHDDYCRWKRTRIYPKHDPEAPQLMDIRQFGSAIRRVVTGRDPPGSGNLKRFMSTVRVCNRGGGRKRMRAIRGVQHPDGYHLRVGPGRPSLNDITPLPD